MSRTRLIVIILFALLLVQPTIDAAYALSAREENKPDRSFSLDTWISGADADWQISFPYSGVSGTGRVESELNFKKINSPMTILKGSGALNPDWTLNVTYGFGSINNGRGTDTDRFISLSGNVNTFSESKEDISGDVRLWEITLVNRKALSNQEKSPWGLSLGFTHYEDKLLMTGGIQTISGSFDGSSFPPVGTVFSGLRSTYDFYWNALKVGGLYEWSRKDRLSLTGSLALYPFISYEGEAYWNLRVGPPPDGFRAQAPNFVHDADSGYGFDATVDMHYRLHERTSLRLGYRYLHLKAENGTDKVYFSDGSIGIADLDWAKVTRQGAFAGIEIKF